DAGFERLGGWRKVTVGGIDWTKANETGASVGVEVQVSGRSDMLAVDIMHLKEELVDGTIDVGLIIVPDDALSRVLTDRTPKLATAVKHDQSRSIILAPARFPALQPFTLAELFRYRRRKLPQVLSPTRTAGRLEPRASR